MQLTESRSSELNLQISNGLNACPCREFHRLLPSFADKVAKHSQVNCLLYFAGKLDYCDLVESKTFIISYRFTICAEKTV